MANSRIVILSLVGVTALGFLTAHSVHKRWGVDDLLEDLAAGNPTVKKEDTDEITKEEKLQTPFSFEDIFNPELRPRGFDGTWISDNTYVYRDSEGDVYEVDAETGTQTLLMPNSVLAQFNTGTYTVSPDLNFVLIAVNRTQVWRHSYNAVYKIYNREEADPDSQIIDFPNGGLEGEILQFADWSETGTYLSFVYGNNLYFQESPTTDPVQVSTSGVDQYVFNGIPDWVYEEDVVSSGRGHFFSSDSQYITYVEYNDTSVPQMAWPRYGAKEDVYGHVTRVAYPKAGDGSNGEAGAISTVRIFAVSTADVTQRVELLPPEDIQDQFPGNFLLFWTNKITRGIHYVHVDGYYYYTRIAWQDNSHVYVHWTNRAQNMSISMLYDVTIGAGQMNINLTVPGGWIDSPAPAPVFINGGSQYLTLRPQDVQDAGTYPHIALVTAPELEEGEVMFLTSGPLNVISIVGFDDVNNTVYFTSPGDDITERHVFRVGTPDAAPEQQPVVCLTCEYPASCRYLSATFSKPAKYYIERCGGPDIPTYRLKGMESDTDVDLENNSDVQARLAEKELPTRIFYDIDVGGGYTGKAEVFIPYGDTGVDSYSTMVYTYAGPSSQRVSKSYPMGSNTANWLTYMKSTHRIVVASLDGRGASNRGDRNRYELYRSLGTKEIEDQILGLRWLKDQSYVDSSSSAAIFGWSYGGFTTAHALADSTAEDFQCGISVAPVTSFRYYDSAYTERYMALDTPGDNQGGYNNADVMTKASQFLNKQYLLAHGTADDNVHFMNMAQLVTALVEEEVQFRQLMYVDENHSIGSPFQSRHLYRAMTDFLLNDCWTD